MHKVMLRRQSGAGSAAANNKREWLEDHLLMRPPARVPACRQHLSAAAFPSTHCFHDQLQYNLQLMKVLMVSNFVSNPLSGWGGERWLRRALATRGHW